MTRKPPRAFTCQDCGQVHPRWAGRCDACGAWNTLVEEKALSPAAFGVGAPESPRELSEIEPDAAERHGTGIAELDRVLGGGLVRGSAVLFGGDPGVGKSTLLLELAAHYAATGKRPLYATAEESCGQVALRARRLGIDGEGVRVLAEDKVERIVDFLLDEPPDLLIVDSIQTVRKGSVGSAPGSVAQVRECAADLVSAARRARVPIALVGHVTKDGLLAGPKVLEHLVDVVLYFEGEREGELRLLRSLKNRYGPSGEVAVFAMTERGLRDPEQPAAAFLGAASGLPGSAVTAAVEGSRVFLVEIQALTAPASYGPPRIRVNGIDPPRAQMLAAVLTRRAGLHLGDQDIHLNVAGGLRLSDPGCDLAVCLAIASSFVDKPLLPRLVAFGEVGLGGEVRAVKGVAGRLREAAALGFERIALPAGGEAVAALDARRVARIDELFDLLA